jgi:hypothetical protein
MYLGKGNILRMAIGVWIQVKVSGLLHCTIQRLLGDISETQRKLKSAQPIYGAN